MEPPVPISTASMSDLRVTAIEEWLPIFHRRAEQRYIHYKYDKPHHQSVFEHWRRHAYDGAGRIKRC
ncbi:hypothetical protein REMIM1_CH02137 [Rhizobium etli bv. mimosae str. Mim1]|nr:hypothetical protein REMIM1_CH02137 [Rhizobium etli bv. mimosae str. Mim1]